MNVQYVEHSRWRPTLAPSQRTWAVAPPTGWHHLQYTDHHCLV